MVRKWKRWRAHTILLAASIVVMIKNITSKLKYKFWSLLLLLPETKKNHDIFMFLTMSSTPWIAHFDDVVVQSLELASVHTVCLLFQLWIIRPFFCSFKLPKNFELLIENTTATKYSWKLKFLQFITRDKTTCKATWYKRAWIKN